MSKEIFSPVIIITCNRLSHLKECIDSLKKCKYANETEIYISVDYPPSDEYVEGYNLVVNYLKQGIFGFKKVNIIYQEKNLGPEKNQYFLEDLAFEKYDSIIYCEDDNVFSYNYLEYMNFCLNYYRNDPNCYAIDGHRYPIELRSGNNSVVRMFNDSDAWGFGMWKDKTISARNYMFSEEYKRQAYDYRKMYSLLKQNSKIFCYYVRNLYDEVKVMKSYNGWTRVLDISLASYLIFNKMYVVVPTITKVVNKGWDGSGQNCGSGSEYRWETQEYDISDQFEYSFNEAQEDIKYNILSISKYHKESIKNIFVCVCKLLLFNMRRDIK